MSKSEISLWAAGGDMRQRALKAIEHSHYTVLQNRMVEEVYPLKIADLAGKSFRPLSGFTVSFDEVLPMAQAREPSVADVASFDYVEYGTGYRLKVYLTVELDEDYLPLGVELQAFIDAVKVQTEQMINACGYTFNDAPIMGLRSVNNYVGDCNALFENLFVVDEALTRLVKHNLNDQQPLIFEETASDFRFSAAINALQFHTRLGNEVVMVHVDELGALAALDERRIWITTTIVDDGTGMQKRVTSYALDVCPEKGDVHYCLDIRPFDSAVKHSFALETQVVGKDAIVIQPRDWKGRERTYDLAVDDPGSWRILHYHRGVHRYNHEYPEYINRELFKGLNLALPALLSAPARSIPVGVPRFSIRRWLADLFRSWSDRLNRG
ncbi:hypothetical protein [Xanthomonas phage RTH11]|nr:hypothetical protein [Xanthomonas phage RTH11]